jgi:Gpi18-like mannosyltransferase
MRDRSSVDWWTIGLLCLGCAARVFGLPFQSLDAINFTIPWYNALSNGGVGVLGTDFSNYNPPYLYLLWLASVALGASHPLLAVKCVSILGDFGLCVAVALLVKRSSVSTVTSLRAFSIAWCLPTMIVNSSVWGQCDALYALFVVAAFAAAVYLRPALAFSLFGIAVAIKLQAILAAPAMVLLLLSGRLPWRYVPAAVASYFAALVPAALAGRDWVDLLTVYAKQAHTYPYVSLDAPNIWSLLRTSYLEDWTQVHYSVLVAAGFVLTTTAMAIYLLLGRRRVCNSTGRDDSIVEMAFVATFVCAYLLPKMLNRYFFLADVLSATLAIGNRRWLPVAILVQIGSLCAYAPFLLGVHRPLLFGVAANTLVFTAIVLRWCPTALRLLPARLQGAIMALAS